MLRRYYRVLAPAAVLLAARAPAHQDDAPDRQAPSREAPSVQLRLRAVEAGLAALPHIAAGESPNVLGVAPTVDLGGEHGNFGLPAECFVTKVRGFLRVATAGAYTFRLVSDDGSRLWIDDGLIVTTLGSRLGLGDHDGLHGPVPKDGSINLQPGPHTLRIAHFEVIPEDRMAQVREPPAAEPPNVLTEQEVATGWRLIFDGKTTAGWRGFKKDDMRDGWQVEDGCLVRVGPGGDIVTVEQFDNFELSLEWRISQGGNSGIFFRVSEEPPNRYVWETGPEMQVLDNAEHADGRNPKTSAASNYALHAPTRDATQPVGLFNQVRIVAEGPHVEYWLNGEKVIEYEIGSPDWEKLVAESKFKSVPRYGRMPSGHIALQDHGDRVWYRNIKIRPLPPRGEPR